ncbi:MAG: hypothetical protein IPO60_00755 [Flavobacteriales bacterium]|nr:hypothetical protein [Flavobacteriales bacterium]MBK6891579.1 hypothetical protein [Flavobacteriales bacterium]MBK7247505.1 hypothetical protein [Flavobacteriales bacterium]MBK7286431.1 hypothetical protein [Flavobacteriales bacterium]MBK9596871.1 hypothetical protein [Flavobacteriales bacterium]
MKNIRHLLIAATIMVSGEAFAQADVTNHGGGFGYYLGWNANALQNLEIRHDGDFPIQFWTSGDFRGLINEKVTYGSLNGFPNIPADGFNLITPNDGFLHQASKGPFSRLHLAEGGEDLNAQEWGYRPWQRNGITFTGNGDQGYIGHKYKDKDVTDMVIQWSDNPGTWKGDRMRFLFTSGYNPSATTGMNSAEGLEGMRLFPSEHDEIFVGVGDFYAGGDDPTERLDVRTGRVRIRKLPTDPEAATLDQYMVVDNTGVVKWRHLPSVSSCSSGWSLQGNNAVTAFNGNPCPPQDANYVGMGTPLSGFTLPVNSPPSFYTTKVNVLNNNFNTGMLSKTTRSTTGENFGVMTDVTGSSYLNAGIEVNVHGYSPYTRGIRVKGTSKNLEPMAQALIVRDSQGATKGSYPKVTD